MRKGKQIKIGTQTVDGKTYAVYSNTVDISDVVKEDSAFTFYMSMNSDLEANIFVPSNTPGFGKVFFRIKGSGENINLQKMRFRYERRRFRKPKIVWISNEQISG